MRSLMPILFAISLSACSSTYDFEFDKNKSEYESIAECLRKNYALIRSYDSVGTRSSIYQYDLQKLGICLDAIGFLKSKEIEFAHLGTDSTVWFFVSKGGGIAGTQFILMHTSNESNVKDEVSTTIERLKKNYGDGWYEFERDIGVVY
jgi:hypothetical protein